MPKANLDRCWSFHGRAFGPGDAEIPQGLHDILSPKGYLGTSQASEDAPTSLFEGLSEEQVANLKAAGYGNADAIREVSVEDLKTVNEIGNVSAMKLKRRTG